MNDTDMEMLGDLDFHAVDYKKFSIWHFFPKQTYDILYNENLTVEDLIEAFDP